MARFLNRSELIERLLAMNTRWLDERRATLASLEAGEIRFLRGSVDASQEAIHRDQQVIEDLTAAIAELERQKG